MLPIAVRNVASGVVRCRSALRLRSSDANEVQHHAVCPVDAARQGPESYAVPGTDLFGARTSRGRVGVMQLRDPAHHVSPRAILFWTIRALPGWFLLLAGQSLWFILSPDRVGLRIGALAVTVLLAAAHLIVMPRWRYRVHRWEVTDTAVYTQSGWISQERRIAPISRVQTVDTERGPLEQLFRLSNVTVTTASVAGPLHIHGLDRATADRLVAELTEVTSHSGGDAT